MDSAMLILEWYWHDGNFGDDVVHRARVELLLGHLLCGGSLQGGLHGEDIVIHG